MRKRVGHEPQLLHQLLDPLEHRIDRRGDHGELLAFGLLVEPMCEVPGRDLRRDPPDRPRPALGHPKQDQSADQPKRNGQQKRADERFEQRRAHSLAILDAGAKQQPLPGRQPDRSQSKQDRLATSLRVEPESRPNPRRARSVGGQAAILPAIFCPRPSTSRIAPLRTMPVLISSLIAATTLAEPLRP